jgi:sensor histidine kinase regulating citrate/malate metabolism
VTKIKYFESHKTIDDIEIAYMLSVLLENAIETLTNKPIFVEVLCSENRVLIKVENDTKEKTQDELNNMLLKNHSTKGKVGRGFGLAKLDTFVQKHHGNIEITQAYHNEQQVNYLTIMVYI